MCMLSPDGRTSVHSPPDARTTRSRRAGPKNQLVKIIQTPVATAHLAILRVFERMLEGVVSHSAQKATEVHAHVFFIKYTFKKFDLLAK